MSTRSTVFMEPEWLTRCGVHVHVYRELIDEHRLWVDLGDGYGICFPLRAPWRIEWERGGGWHPILAIRRRGKFYHEWADPETWPVRRGGGRG